MSRVSIGFFVAFGVVLVAFCAGRQGHAQEPKGTGSAPAKSTSAPPSPAAHETQPDLGPPTGVFGGRPSRSRTAHNRPRRASRLGS